LCTTGQLEPHPEPEPLDLPEDLQLDGGENKDGGDEEGQEENPFDIDKMKGEYKVQTSCHVTFSSSTLCSSHF
jgi:hypothetical protein